MLRTVITLAPLCGFLDLTKLDHLMTSYCTVIKKVSGICFKLETQSQLHICQLNNCILKKRERDKIHVLRWE